MLLTLDHSRASVKLLYLEGDMKRAILALIVVLGLGTAFVGASLIAQAQSAQCNSSGKC